MTKTVFMMQIGIKKYFKLLIYKSLTIKLEETEVL